MTEDREPFRAEPARPRYARPNLLERAADILCAIGVMILAAGIVSYLAWAVWAMFKLVVHDRLSAPAMGAIFMILSMVGAVLIVLSVFLRD